MWVVMRSRKLTRHGLSMHAGLCVAKMSAVLQAQQVYNFMTYWKYVIEFTYPSEEAICIINNNNIAITFTYTCKNSDKF